MDSNPADSTKPPPSLSDPNLVNTLVEELKSKGIFDQIRNDALAEVDTKPAYQNLRQRVESSVSRYLNKHSADWKPTANKQQLRNMLRKHIQDGSYLDVGVQGIVDQVVGPKIQQIQPDVENILYKMFGVEKPDSNDEEEEMMEDNTVKSEKLSNISSDIDVEMKSVTDEQPQQLESVVVKEHEGEHTDASSPGPGLRGDMSPLTPEKNSPEAPRGDVSPLTPPPPPSADPDQPPPPGTERVPSPRTPPGPPPSAHHAVFEQEIVEEEVITRGENISPVSEGEFGDISPPKGSPETPDDSGMPSPPRQPSPPPLPPLPPSESGTLTPPLPPPPPRLPAPMAKRPPSPITSPIESSSDERSQDETLPMESNIPVKSGVSASDISDAELPSQSDTQESSDNVEELEKARAELLAKLAASAISDAPSEETSEGEITSDNNKSQKSEAEEDKAEKTEEEQDDHEQAKRALDKNSSPKDPDDPNGGPSNAGKSNAPEGNQTNTATPLTSSSTDDKSAAEPPKSAEQEQVENEIMDLESWYWTTRRPSSEAQNSSSQAQSESKKRRDSKSKEGSSSSGERRSSKDSRDSKDSKDRHSHSRDHKDHHRDHHKDHNRHRDNKDRDYKRSSSSSGGDHHGSSSRDHHSSSSSHHKKSHKRDKERHGSNSDRKSTSSSSSSGDHRDHKHHKSEKTEKTKQKLAEIEAQVKKTSEQRFKSDKFSGFDMFAPKTPKQVVKKPQLNLSTPNKQMFTPPSPVVGGSRTPNSTGSSHNKSVSSSPGTPMSSSGSGSKPVFPEKKVANTSNSNTSSAQNSTPVSKKEISKSSKDKQARRSSESGNPFIVHEPRQSQKIYPELRVSQTEGVDKERQHNDDIAETKRLLQIARQRREAEMKREKEMKRQRKKSTSKSSPNKLSTQKSNSDKIDSNSADSADDVKRYDSHQPDSPKTQPKSPKNAKTSSLQEVLRRKSSKDLDNSGSDSDIEWKSTIKAVSKKNRKRQGKFEDSDSEEELGVVEVKGEAPIISTRKTLQKTESDAILIDDDEIEPLHGFDTNDKEFNDLTEDLKIYEDLLANNGAKIKADPVTEKDMETVTDPIWIENAHLYPGGAAKLVPVLKKTGEGHPKVVRGIPDWLDKKLSLWKLKRNEVEIVTEPSKIRKRRIYTEEEYDLKCGVQPPKVAKVILDKSAALDDIEAQLALLDSADSADEMEISQSSPSKLTKTSPTKKLTKTSPAKKVNKTPSSAKKVNKTSPAKKVNKTSPAKKVNKTPSAKKLKKIPVVNQITPPNEINFDSSDEEEFRGFEMNSTQFVNCTAFGLEFGLHCDEILNNLKVNTEESAKNEETSSKFDVLFSPGLLTHMKKVLKKDQEAMSVLNTINTNRKMADTGMKLVTASPPPVSPQIKKNPTDYPMPPSPESNSPSDTSDKGSTSPQEESTTPMDISGQTELTSSQGRRRSSRKVF